MFNGRPCAEAVPNLELKEPERGKGEDAAEEMTADLAVGPVKQRLDPELGSAHLELPLDGGSVKGRLYDLLRSPVVLVCHDDILFY